MNFTKVVRAFCFAGLAPAVGGSGCALEPQSSDDSLGRETQAWTIPPGDAAFASSLNPPGNGNANPQFSYNSSGATNLLTHVATGQYRVDIPNLGATPGGHVQVSSLGSGDRRCKVGSWGSSGSTIQVDVFCFTRTGAPADEDFSASYVRRTDTPGAQAGYVWAFDSQSSSYNAAGQYGWNSTGGAITITHTSGTGSYAVNFTGQSMGGGTVEVTAYGSTTEYCKVSSWIGSTVNVLCFDTTGHPVETRFDVLYSKVQPNGTPSSSYLWANQQTTTSYHPIANYALGLLQVDSSQVSGVITTPPTITRRGIGTYDVVFPSMAASRSFPMNEKVTAYGTDYAFCKGVTYLIQGGNSTMRVTCWDPAGNPMDSRYTITYSSFAFNIG